MSGLPDDGMIPPDDEQETAASAAEATTDKQPETNELPEPLPLLQRVGQTAEHEAVDTVRPPGYRPISRPQRGLYTTLAGILLLALGVILIWPVLSGGYMLMPGAIAAIALGGFALSLLAYWLYSGRQARGALFLALIFLFWLAAAALSIAGGVFDYRQWPLYVAQLGLAILLTAAADRGREARLVTPGIIFLLGGAIGLLATYEVIPAMVLGGIAERWPWVLLVAILALLPLAFQRAPRRRQ